MERERERERLTDGLAEWPRAQNRGVGGGRSVAVEFDGCLVVPLSSPLLSSNTTTATSFSRAGSSLLPSLLTAALMVLTKKNLREIPAELDGWTTGRAAFKGLSSRARKEYQKAEIQSLTIHSNIGMAGCQSLGNDEG